MNAIHVSSDQPIDVKRQRSGGFAIAAVVGIAVLMPLAWYVLLYQEPLDLLKRVSSDALALQEEHIRERRTILASLQALDAEYATLDQAVIKTILSAIPQEQHIPELIVNISQIIARSGGKLEDFSIRELSPPKALQSNPTDSISIQLSVTNVSYEAFKQLIRTLYQNGRVFSLRSLEYTPENSSVTLSLEAYSFSGK